MDKIITYKKHRFSPLEPKESDIDIDDISHCLARIPRANGHFTEFFPVAMHCINCAEEASSRGLSAKISLILLLHDASEAYICDIVRPVKKEFKGYLKYEKILQDVILSSFGIHPDDPERSFEKEIDDAMLYYEFVHFADERLMDEVPKIFSEPDFSFLGFDEVEKRFRDKFRGLYKEVFGSER